MLLNSFPLYIFSETLALRAFLSGEHSFLVISFGTHWIVGIPNS